MQQQPDKSPLRGGARFDQNMRKYPSKSQNRNANMSQQMLDRADQIEDKSRMKLQENNLSIMRQHEKNMNKGMRIVQKSKRL